MRRAGLQPLRSWHRESGEAQLLSHRFLPESSKKKIHSTESRVQTNLKLYPTLSSSTASLIASSSCSFSLAPATAPSASALFLSPSSALSRLTSASDLSASASAALSSSASAEELDLSS